MARARLDLEGGPLAGVRASVTAATARTGTLRIPAAHGRYVDADGVWTWETDATPARNLKITPPSRRRTARP